MLRPSRATLIKHIFWYLGTSLLEVLQLFSCRFPFSRPYRANPPGMHLSVQTAPVSGWCLVFGLCLAGPPDLAAQTNGMEKAGAHINIDF